MPTSTYRTRLLSRIREQEDALTALFTTEYARFADLLFAVADKDGTIPQDKLERLKQQLAALVFQMYLARSLDGDLAPFVFASGGVTATAPIPRLLWGTIRDSMRIAVEEQAALMRNALPANAERTFRTASANPFTTDLPTWAQGGVDRYEHPLQARRADNRLLTDRLAIAAMEARRKITLFIDTLVAEGKRAAEIASELKQWMIGKTARKNTPYGDSLRSDINRIARSEPIYAYSQASLISAALNPAVVQVDVLRTRRESCDICDPIAQGSPYAVEDCPMPGYHGYCACRLRYHVDRAGQRVNLRANEIAAVMTPLSPHFLDIITRPR